jgi:hypothetical protein
MHLIEISWSSRILLVMYAFQQDEQKVWSHERQRVLVCEWSKQIRQTKGSIWVEEEDLAINGESARLNLELFESAVDRRADRCTVPDKEREPVMRDELERMGTRVCVCEAGGSQGEIPAAVLTEDMSSMHFSIRLSLFQLMYRRRRDAVLAWNKGYCELTIEALVNCRLTCTPKM